MAGHASTAILIAGMHRSGTSALAGALGKLGISLGERLLEPGSDNPKGYWEHQDVVAVHECLLAALGSSWDDVRALPSGWLSSDPAKRAAEAISDLVSRDFSGKPLWAVKDPRLCRFLPLWLEVLLKKKIHPVVLFAVRDPGEVSASIEARNHWQAPIGEMLWLRYNIEAESASRKAARSVVVYDDLLAKPLPVVARALAALKLGFDPSRATGRDELAGFIDKADRHHVRSRLQKPADGFPALADAVYRSLLGIAHDEDTWLQFGEHAAKFEQRWQRQGAAMNALAGMAVTQASRAESEWIENQRVASRFAAQVQWSQQAQMSREALQAENAELASKLTAQVAWSEAAAKKHETLQAENAELASKLTAQVAWSEAAAKKHEALQAENADLASRLTAQVAWSEAAAKKREALQAENAGLKSRLEAAAQAIEAAQAQCGELSNEKQHLSDELEAQARASALASQASSEVLERAAAERSKLAAALASSRHSLTKLESELGAVYASTSWKLTKPMRAVAKTFMPGGRGRAGKDKGGP